MNTDKVDPAPPTVNSKKVALGKLLKKSQEKVTNNQNRRITKTPNSKNSVNKLRVKASRLQSPHAVSSEGE